VAGWVCSADLPLVPARSAEMARCRGASLCRAALRMAPPSRPAVAAIAVCRVWRADHRALTLADGNRETECTSRLSIACFSMATAGEASLPPHCKGLGSIPQRSSHVDDVLSDAGSMRWRTFVDDLGRFLNSGLAARATTFEWDPHDQFGCDRDWPFLPGPDQLGLLRLAVG
jgi:hypothetical protein